MSRSANPVAVGLFTLAGLALAVILVLLFSGKNWWQSADRYDLIYDTSVRGLNVGAPVTLKGVEIGQVRNIHTRIHGESRDIFNVVTVEIDTSSIQHQDMDARSISVDRLIELGLRAQLRQQSVLTGMLYVDVDFDPVKPVMRTDIDTEYPQLPTTPTNLQQLTRDLETIDVNRLASDLQQALGGINKLVNDPATQALPARLTDAIQSLEQATVDLSRMGVQLTDDYSRVADNANTLLTDINRDLPRMITSLDETLAALNDSADSFDEFAANAAFLTSSDSPTLYRLNEAANSIDQAARQLRSLSDLLERQPEALIFGRGDED